MYPEFDKARQLLENGNHTCVLYGGETVITDDRRGIRPLMELLDRQTDVKDFFAADKVVGKAAAFLYCLLGVRAVYAHVISQPAAKVLAQAGIALEYGTMVSAIRNRTNTGFCPMETAVWEISDPQEALQALKDALCKL